MKVICKGILQGQEEKKKSKKLILGFVVVQKTTQSEDLETRRVGSKTVDESKKGEMSHVGMSLMKKKLENCLKEAHVVQMRA